MYSQLSDVYRISLTLACPMNLKLYPLDRQICSLRMASCEWWYSSELALTDLNWIYFVFSKCKRLQNHWIQYMSKKNILIKYTRDISIIVQLLHSTVFIVHILHKTTKKACSWHYVTIICNYLVFHRTIAHSLPCTVSYARCLLCKDANICANLKSNMD